jgi:hypothetical protein
MDSYPDASAGSALDGKVFATLVKPFDLNEIRQVIDALQEVRCAA